MLTNGFYNLAEKKKKPTVRVGGRHGGVCLGFTDSVGDELEVILTPETLAEVISKVFAFAAKGKASK